MLWINSYYKFMDIEKLQSIFEDKYERKLGTTFGDWIQTAPDTEEEAYARCQYLDEELKETYDLWFNASGEDREAMEEYRDKLKSEYDLIEEMFGLELKDK